MTYCLLCGTLNNDDFERCSLCKTEPERVLRVLTESQRWVNVTLVTLVFLALASSVAIDLYLAHRVIFQMGTDVQSSLSDPFDPSSHPEGKDATPGQPSLAAIPGWANGQQIIRLILDFFLITLWLVLSVGIVGGSMYATKRATMWVCNEVMRQILRGKVARNEYIFSGVGMGQTAHFDQVRSKTRGTL